MRKLYHTTCFKLAKNMQSKSSCTYGYQQNKTHGTIGALEYFKYPTWNMAVDISIGTLIVFEYWINNINCYCWDNAESTSFT